MNIDASVIGVAAAIFLAIFGFLWVINTRLSRLESKVDGLESKIDGLESKIDGMAERIISVLASHEHDKDGRAFFRTLPVPTDDGDGGNEG